MTLEFKAFASGAITFQRSGRHQPVDETACLKLADRGGLTEIYSAAENGRRQQGHISVIPFASPVKAVGWGIVMMALAANGSR